MTIHVKSIHDYSLSEYVGLASFGSLQILRLLTCQGSGLTMEDVVW